MKHYEHNYRIVKKYYTFFIVIGHNLLFKIFFSSMKITVHNDAHVFIYFFRNVLWL